MDDLRTRGAVTTRLQAPHPSGRAARTCPGGLHELPPDQAWCISDASLPRARCSPKCLACHSMPNLRCSARCWGGPRVSLAGPWSTLLPHTWLQSIGVLQYCHLTLEGQQGLQPALQCCPGAADSDRGLEQPSKPAGRAAPNTTFISCTQTCHPHPVAPPHKHTPLTRARGQASKPWPGSTVTFVSLGQPTCAVWLWGHPGKPRTNHLLPSCHLPHTLVHTHACSAAAQGVCMPEFVGRGSGSCDLGAMAAAC